MCFFSIYKMGRYCILSAWHMEGAEYILFTSSFSLSPSFHVHHAPWHITLFSFFPPLFNFRGYRKGYKYRRASTDWIIIPGSPPDNSQRPRCPWMHMEPIGKEVSLAKNQLPPCKKWNVFIIRATQAPSTPPSLCLMVLKSWPVNPVKLVLEAGLLYPLL